MAMRADEIEQMIRDALPSADVKINDFLMNVVGLPVDFSIVFP